jgi:aldehyde dehydrogenase (NAD+)
MDAFLAAAEAVAWEERRAGPFGSDVVVRREPVGVVGVITPWNVPHFVTIARLMPALLMGCTVILKPAPRRRCPGWCWRSCWTRQACRRAWAACCRREIGEHLVRHPVVGKISFTGSTAAGRRIATLCGQDLRRVTLELGGKSAAIILDDADGAQGLQLASLMNSGHACIAQTRIPAPRHRHRHRHRHDEFMAGPAEMVGGLTVAPPKASRRPAEGQPKASRRPVQEKRSSAASSG